MPVVRGKLAEADRKLDQLRFRLPIGSRWKHYKTDAPYQVLDLALDEETLEVLVLYTSMEVNRRWIRRASVFLEELEPGKYRFTRID